MNLYLDNGYLDVKSIIEYAIRRHLPFIFVIGARGIGKSYNANDYLINDLPEGRKFMYVRRLDKQIKKINVPDYSPFRANYEDGNIPYLPVMDKIGEDDRGLFKSEQSDDGQFHAVGEPIGYPVPLSTFANIRGINAPDVDFIFFDEFIPEPRERSIKDEAGAFENMYETINRNRELKGKDPVMVFCAANSNDIGNPIFIAWKLVNICLNMRKNHREVYVNEDRGIMIVMPRNSPISKAKAETALYRATKNTGFSDMALENLFLYENEIRSVSRSLKEYSPLVTVAELTIYRHKGNQMPLYCTSHRSGTCPQYGGSEVELKRFASKYAWLWLAYMRDRLEFEDYGAELLFQKYFKY